jgi:aryl carrier-like protein
MSRRALELQSGGVGRVHNSLEARLLELWGGVLGAPIERDDDLFDAGADSLLALRMLGLAKQEGLEIPLRAFWETPTVRELAARIA